MKMARLPRLPILSDFSTSCYLSIIPSQNKNSAVINALILLHGIGDSEVPFKNFAESMALPATVGISLRAPHPIPPFLTGSDTPGFRWSDDLLFDEPRNCLDGDAGFSCAIKLLEEIVMVLLHQCGFKERDIWFLGFGQGAMAALGLITKMERDGKASPDGFGGVVAIGAGLPKESLTWIPTEVSEKLKTPVLLCGGSNQTQVTRNTISCLKDRFGNFLYVKWEKQGDGMPRNREEMLPIMKFFAQRMRSWAGVPDGAIEL